MNGTALICGASEGIGEAFARRLAGRGMSLVLVARRREPLEALAASLRAEHRIDVRTIAVDLASPDLLGTLEPVLSDGLDLLVYNAASVEIAPLLEQDPARMDLCIAVNISAPMHLCRAVAPGMVTRGRGGIVLMGSMSGLQGTAMLGTYAATKAFIATFGESLWEELRGTGVDVVVCQAGATTTPGFLQATPKDRQKQAFPMSPDAVAQAALEGLGRGPVVVPGAMNKVVHAASRLLPRGTAVRLFSHATRRLYEEPDSGEEPR